MQKKLKKQTNVLNICKLESSRYKKRILQSCTPSFRIVGSYISSWLGAIIWKYFVSTNTKHPLSIYCKDYICNTSLMCKIFSNWCHSIEVWSKGVFWDCSIFLTNKKLSCFNCIVNRGGPTRHGLTNTWPVLTGITF